MTTSNLGRIAVVSQGDWVAGTYKALDIVRYNGAAYIAKVGTSTVPTNTSYWSLLVNDGTPNYTWIKYADDSIGTGLSDSPANKIFIGIAVNKVSATESTVATDYTWSQIKGNDGSPTYTWIKYADDAIGTGLSNTSAGKSYIGIAVNKTSTTESTTAGDYEWTLIKGEKGDTGTNGTGTVNSVAALTITTTGTDLTSTVADSTSTPVITINVPSASATARGVLTSTDWTTFNTKQAALVSGTNIKTVNGNSLLGSGDITITGGSGTVTSIAMTVPSFLSVTGSPITASGTLSVTLSGTALPVLNGGTGVTTSTGSGSVVLNTSPTLVTPTATGLKETKVAMVANDVNLASGNYFTKTIIGATTFTVSNVPTTGTVASFILDLTNGGAGTITWWSGVKWAGGTAPTLTTTGRDSLGFFTHDAGTTWTGLVLGKDIK